MKVKVNYLAVVIIKYFQRFLLTILLRECHIGFLEIHPVMLKVESLFPKPMSVLW